MGTQQKINKYYVILPPFLFLLVFFLIPFFIIFKISLSEAAISSPPYLPLFDIGEKGFSINASLDNYLFLLEDNLYIISYLTSLKIAFIATCITLLVAYPMAYFTAKVDERYRFIILVLIILPFWTSFLLRVYAWIAILKQNGLLNNMLITLGVIDKPLIILQTDLAVYIGIVYTYLPFMILPIYASLVKNNTSLNEAASDLGATPFINFLTITLPLSMPGVIAGSLLVFIPVIGEFVIPSLLGGADNIMIGKILWDEFFRNRDWPIASSVAMVMLFILVFPMIFFRNKFGQES